MPQNLLAIHGAMGLVCAVGENGRIIHFEGDVYRATEPESPTPHTLRGVFVESPYSAWVCGDAGTVLRWVGARWLSQAVATRLDALNCIWGHPADGVWVGGRRYLFNYQRTYGASLYTSDVEIRTLWGRGPEDIWYLCTGRLAMHWDGERCERIELPGDPDEEWSAVAGTDAGTFIAGPSGFMLHYDGRAWSELPTDTTDLITGAVGAGPSLYVTTDGGMVREWDGRTWRTVAFSAFGGLNGICFVDGVVWAAGARGVVIQHQPDDGGGKE